MRPFQPCLIAVALVCAATSPLAAQVAKPWHAKNVQAVDAWTQTQRAQWSGNTNMLICRGVVANRATRRVDAIAEATGLDAGAIAEFLVVGENSDKDYEALSVAFARASDLARGIEFIGVPRGRPIDPAICQFWSKGERVSIAVRPFGADDAASRPLSGCLTDKRTPTPLPTAFIYAGSHWTSATTRAVCRADAPTPGAIVSTYNEPTVLLDVPEAAPQSEVYGNLVVTPEGHFAAGTLLLLTLTPEPRPNGIPRVVTVSLDVLSAPAAQPADKTAGAGLGALACVTHGAEADLAPATNDLTGALSRLETLSKAGRDPFVTLSLDESLTVATATALARVLKSVEGPGGIRIEPPPAGQLYFKAFLPDDAWRTRSTRMAQPWELRLGRDKTGVWRFTLVQIQEDWSKPGQLNPDLAVKEHPLDRWEDLPAKIKSLGGGLNTLFVFAPADAPLSAFMPAVRLVRGTQPTVFVFGD